MIEKGFYHHYKGKIYCVYGEAKHTEEEDKAPHVVYMDPTTKQFFIRPVSSFIETVVVEDKELPRFRKMGEEELQALFAEVASSETKNTCEGCESGCSSNSRCCH